MRSQMMPREDLQLDEAYSVPVCVHTETGRTRIHKTCLRHCECWHCAFDQWLDETERAQVRTDPFTFSHGPIAHAA